jgi:hypothetical protein
MDTTRSLSSVIKFLDTNSTLSDVEISNIAKQLKFSEVLDLVGLVSKDETEKARNILAQHDDRFAATPEVAPEVAPDEEPQESITMEYSNVPSAPKTSSMFKPIRPVGAQQPHVPGQQTGNPDEVDADAIGAELDKAKGGHSAEVNQIKNMLQRISR